MRRTRPASPEQAAEMTATLTRGYEYDLEPVARLPRGHYRTRLKALTDQDAQARAAAILTPA
jgi:hypothetical protein